jgi:hypothetical protein
VYVFGTSIRTDLHYKVTFWWQKDHGVKTPLSINHRGVFTPWGICNSMIFCKPTGQQVNSLVYSSPGSINFLVMNTPGYHDSLMVNTPGSWIRIRITPRINTKIYKSFQGISNGTRRSCFMKKTIVKYISWYYPFKQYENLFQKRGMKLCVVTDYAKWHSTCLPDTWNPPKFE